MKVYKLSHIEMCPISGHSWKCACELCNISMFIEFDKALEQGYKCFDTSDITYFGSLAALMDSYTALGHTFTPPHIPGQKNPYINIQ